MTYPMNTPAGFAGFLKNSRVNELFKNILDEYGRWLTTAESTSSIVADKKGGWLSDDAMETMDGRETFIATFNCEPSKEHYGYRSFDDFFTRTLRDDARPLPPADPDVIVNACENAPFRIERHVQRRTTFWAKKMPYSLQYILDNDPNIEKFVGGTVFQGFLSPHTYHRFHAPVSGKVVSSRVVQGTYFSHPYYMDGTGSYMTAQPYLGHVATRGIIIIDTENPKIGLVAFVPIGMVDVSTVDLDLISGKKRVNIGDNIGTFHFGGSTHMLIFEKKAQLEFDLQGIPLSEDGTEFLHVRTRLARVAQIVK